MKDGATISSLDPSGEKSALKGHNSSEEKLKDLLQKIEREVVPTASERTRMDALSRRLLDRTERAVKSTGLDGIPSLQGSVAKDTWLHEQADLDVFVQFPPTVQRSEWTTRVLPLLRREFTEYEKIERYAEHPFLELITTEGVRVNIVPCYRVEKGKWLSATDRTPYHKEYMNSKLTDATRLEVRLLKRFCMGIGVYGAEIKTGGFSGMLVETLTVYYGSFHKLLRNAEQWKTGLVLDVEQAYKGRQGEASRKFEENSIIVIDPVDSERNLAAALRSEKFWSFVVASRAFLDNPNHAFFYPAERQSLSSANARRRISNLDNDLLAISFKHGGLVPDILWGQLYRLEKTLSELMKKHGLNIVRSLSWSDEKTNGALLYLLEGNPLPAGLIRQGPPVEREIESRSFLARHQGARDTRSGPWIEGNRWIVEKKREIRAADQLLKKALSSPGKFNLTIPSQLEHGLKNRKILVNEKVADIIGSNRSFGEALREFLDGRPSWMSYKTTKQN